MTAQPNAVHPVDLVVPLDPDSDEGREVAARLSKTFADVEIAIAARKARALHDTA